MLSQKRNANDVVVLETGMLVVDNKFHHLLKPGFAYLFIKEEIESPAISIFLSSFDILGMQDILAFYINRCPTKPY